MELILWRHADAESGIPDDERKLTAEGVKQAQAIAHWLRKRLPQDALILVSNARRARETASALSQHFEVRSEIGTAATPQAILDAAGWPEGRRAVVVVVGHQPTLGQAAALAVTGKLAEWSVGKGAVWWLERSGRNAQTIVRAVIAPDFV